MEEFTIKSSVKLAGIFSSITLLIIGSSALLEQMSLDFNAVFYTCKIAIPGSILAGICGYIIGKIIETADSDKLNNKNKHKNKHKKESDLLIDDLLIEDMKELGNK